MSLSDIILIPVTGKERKPDSSLSTSHFGDFFFSYFWLFVESFILGVCICSCDLKFNAEQSLRANHLFRRFSHITLKHQNELFQSCLKLICGFAQSFSHFSLSSALVSDKVGGTGILQDHDEEGGCEYQPFYPRDMPRLIFSFRYLKHFTGWPLIIKIIFNSRNFLIN